MYIVPGSKAFHVSVFPITRIICMFPDSVPSNPAAMYSLWQTSSFHFSSPPGSDDKLCPFFQHFPVVDQTLQPTEFTVRRNNTRCDFYQEKRIIPSHN